MAQYDINIKIVLCLNCIVWLNLTNAYPKEDFLNKNMDSLQS